MLAVKGPSPNSSARQSPGRPLFRLLALLGLACAALLLWSGEAFRTLAGTRPRGGPQQCAELLGFPRVALLFLTRGDLPHSALWAEWLADAAGLVPSASLTREQCRRGRLREVQRVCAPRQGAGPVDRQSLFTVYVHPHPDFEGYPPGSPFSGHQIADRVQTSWGSATLVDAAKALLRAALRDPSNQQFVLLSESCIPLYPPTLVYQQLTGEEKSRLNACRGWAVAEHEWVPELRGPGTNLTYRHWRKSSQWFGLRRAHAEVVVRETQLMEVFREYCRPHMNLRQKRWRQCFVDEHYIPTVLAREGLDDETDCHGGLLSTNFTVKNSTHPVAYRPDAITSTLLLELRNNVFFGVVPKPKDKRQGPPRDQCHSEAAIAHAWHSFTPVHSLGTSGCSRPVHYDTSFLAYQCPLFARKFGNDTVAAVAAAMHDCSSPAPNIVSGCALTATS